MGLNFGGALFPPRGEIIETFDFSDIATGLGFENFWATPVIDTSGTSYALLSTQEHSGNDDTETEQVGEGITTLNFDSSAFNLPRTAKGTAYISSTLNASGNNAISASGQIAVVDSGGTPTTISSVFETPQLATGERSQLLALPLTQTTIKKGEKLRMIMKIIVDVTGGTGILRHNNIGAESVQLKLLMPFRIEI